MRKATLIAAVAVAAIAISPAFAQETADKSKDWCTDAHMKEMDTKVSAITDATKKKAVQTHLDMSKAAFKKGDMKGCVEHMEQAHDAM